MKGTLTRKSVLSYLKVDYYKWIPLSVLIILIIIFSFATPYFYRFENIMNILLYASMYGMMAFGVAFVMISGGLDLSIGSVMAFSSATAVLSMNYFNNVFVGVAFGLFTGIITGLVTGIIVTKGKVNPFIATLGMQLFYYGIAVWILPATLRAEQFEVRYISDGKLLFVNFPIWILIIVFVICIFVLNKTIYGKRLYAVGGNDKIAKLMGINIDGIRIFNYVIIGLLTAIAAIFLVSRSQSASSEFGFNAPFQIIGAVVLGGVSLKGGEGNIVNVLLGVFIYVILENALGLLNVLGFHKLYIWGLLLIGVTIMDNFRTRRL